MLATMVDKENFAILHYLPKLSHLAVSGWALTYVANHNSAFFFPVPPCTEKLIIKFFTAKLIKFFYLNFSCNFFVHIILTCSTCLQITLILISEQPTASWFLVILPKWFNKTKVSHNQAIIGCLTVKLRSKFEIETSKPYFYLVFFWQETVIFVEWTL